MLIHEVDELMIQNIQIGAYLLAGSWIFAGGVFLAWHEVSRRRDR